MNFTYHISVLVQNIIEVKSLLFAQYLEWPFFVPVVAGSSALVGGPVQCSFLGKVTFFSGSPLEGSGIFSLYPYLAFVSDKEDDLALPALDFVLPLCSVSMQTDTLCWVITGNGHNNLYNGPLGIHIH